MAEGLLSATIGFASGVLSGMFGIGGGIITTPAVRLLMHVPALVAVGTPLPVILPGALTGAWSYARRGLADTRVGVLAGLSGALTAVAGASATRLVGGRVVLLGTAVLIGLAAIDMVLQFMRPPRVDAGEEEGRSRSRALVVVIGAVTGLYSGFFGLGGGFVLVPMLSRWLRFPIKRALGTSLVAVAILSVPGTVTHALLGNVDWVIALGLAVGVVPGALVGARVSARADERWIRAGFAVLLVTVGLWLALNEISGLM